MRQKQIERMGEDIERIKYICMISNKVSYCESNPVNSNFTIFIVENP